MIKILTVVGARPNFMKIAPLMEVLEKHSDVSTLLVHTGQHYDENMSEVFFRELGMPKPDIALDVGSSSHAVQTARVMLRFEPVLLEHRPDVVVVVGDVNSTLACALTATKLGVKVAHVEAGLRSYDRTMPEEINRVLTDAISDYLFLTEREAIENLKKEGIPDDKIHFVGNVMIDTLMRHRQKSAASRILEKLALKPREYALLTLHRPTNVDVPETLKRLIDTILDISRDLILVWPVHPRTHARLESSGMLAVLKANPKLRLCFPLGYLDFLRLMDKARVVLTDSGGIQEETTVLGVPCVTLRENTERPVTITQGTNVLAGTAPDRILRAVDDILRHEAPHSPRIPELWDGHAANRIMEILLQVADSSV